MPREVVAVILVVFSTRSGVGEVKRGRFRREKSQLTTWPFAETWHQSPRGPSGSGLAEATVPV